MRMAIDRLSALDEAFLRLDSRAAPMHVGWTLVDGLRDGRFAVVGQAHHALVDGLAAVEVAQLLLDADPDEPPARPRPWSAAPEPSLAERAISTVADRVRAGRAAGSLALKALV